MEEASYLVAPIGGLSTVALTAALTSTDEGLVDKVLSLLVLTGEEQFADLGEVLGGLGVKGFGILTTAPHRAFVERDLLVRETSIAEHAEAAIP